MAAGRKRDADPPTLVRELLRSVETAGTPRGLVLRGEERYFRDKAVDMLRAHATAAGHEVCIHDAERGNADFRLSGLIDDLSGGGLFAARRLIVVRGGADHLQKEGSEPSALTSAVLRFLASPEEPGTVVLSLASLRADHAVSKAVVAAGGRVLDLRKLWDTPPHWNSDPRQAELVLWVVARARELGLRLAPDQAVLVAAAKGNDLFAIDDQLRALESLPGRDLREVVGWNAAVLPWTVADHLLDGDAGRALGSVEALFRGGFQDKSGRRLLDVAGLATMLMNALSRGIRRSLLLATLLARGASESEAARAVGVAGRAQGPALALARTRPPQVWRAMLEEVADVERRAKSNAGADANDFALFALRWSVRPRAGAARTSR